MAEILGTKSRAPTWRENTPEYEEFCQLCERNNWTNTLPKNDADLKAFKGRGINRKLFNRNQLTTKFRKWRNTTLMILNKAEDRFIENHHIYVRRCHETSGIDVKYYEDVHPIIRSALGRATIDDNQNTIKTTINFALGNTTTTSIKGRQKLYFEARKLENKIFAKRWIGVCSTENRNIPRYQSSCLGDLIAITIHDMISQLIRKRGINNKRKIDDIESLPEN